MSRKAEHGQALILIVFSIIGLVGIVALAIDGGNAYAAKRQVQNTADTAALGSALARIKGADWAAETFKIANQNGYNNDGVTNTVTIASPPTSGKYAGNIEYIQVRITSNVPTYFAGVVGITHLTVVGEAVARTKTPQIGPILNGAALISLAPTSDCDSHRSFAVFGESSLSISGGGIFINSNNPSCALLTYGSGSIRMNDNWPISIVGGASVQKPKLLTPFPPTTGVPPISYPPPFFMPDHIPCGKDAVVLDDGHTMSPGGWEDPVFPPDGVTTLEKGVYCIRHDFILGDSSKLEGSDVTIMVIDGKVKWSASAQVNLRATTTGDLKGLLLYMPLENKQSMSLNGNLDSSIGGTILAPGAQIRLNGGAFPAGYRSQIIGYTIVSNGESNIKIDYRDDENWDTLPMPEVQLSQ